MNIPTGPSSIFDLDVPDPGVGTLVLQSVNGVLGWAVVSATLAGLTDVSLSSVAQGNILYRGATAWNNLAPGTATHVLKTGGASANPSWGQVAYSELTGTPNLSVYALADKSSPSPWVSAADLSGRSLADLGTRTTAQLSDWPSGSALQVLRKNAANNALEFYTPSAGVTDHGVLTGLSDDDHSQYLWKSLGRVTQATSPPYAYSPASAWLRNLITPDAGSGGNYYPYSVNTTLNETGYFLLAGVAANGQNVNTDPPVMGLWYSGNSGTGFFLRGWDSHYYTFFYGGGEISGNSWGYTTWYFGKLDAGHYLNGGYSAVPVLTLKQSMNTNATALLSLHNNGGTQIGMIDPAARFLASAGSTSNVSYGKLGDVDTGVYFPAADDVAVVSGGTVRVRANGTGLGFFGVSPIARPTGGAATAGGAYGATEQTMLQAVYDAVRNLGLMT